VKKQRTVFIDEDQAGGTMFEDILELTLIFDNVPVDRVIVRRSGPVGGHCNSLRLEAATLTSRNYQPNKLHRAQALI
jgi:hypothetical protein